MSSRQQRPRWQSGVPGPLAIATVVCIAAVLALSRTGRPSSQDGAPPASSPQPSIAPSEQASAIPISPSASDTPVVTGGVWYSEVSFGTWIAGRIGRPGVVPIPPGQIPIAGAANLVVAVERTASDSRLTIINLDTHRPVVDIAVPFNVGDAAITPNGEHVYISGDDWDGALASDAGVLEVGLDSGSLTQVVEPLTLLRDWAGWAARGMLVIAPSGKTLATTLCGGSAPGGGGTCLVQVIDLVPGRLIGSFGPITSNLAATTDAAVLTTSEGAFRAFAPDGRELWELKVGDVRGRPAAAADAFVVTYAAEGSLNLTRLASVQAETGRVTELYRSEPDERLSVWPEASAADTVIVAESDLMEVALGVAREVPLRMVNVTTGRIQGAGSVSREG